MATLALSLCMEITHRCEAFDTSKILSLLEFCSLQAARSLGGILAPSLLCGTLEGAEIPGPQIKAKGSTWLGRKEKRVLSVVAGKLSSESVDRCCSYLESEAPHNTAAESGDTDLSAEPGRGFSIHHQIESNAEPNRANFKGMPVKHWSTALNMNPGGTPF